MQKLPLFFVNGDVSESECGERFSEENGTKLLSLSRCVLLALADVPCSFFVDILPLLLTLYFIAERQVSRRATVEELLDPNGQYMERKVDVS